MVLYLCVESFKFKLNNCQLIYLFTCGWNIFRVGWSIPLIKRRDKWQSRKKLNQHIVISLIHSIGTRRQMHLCGKLLALHITNNNEEQGEEEPAEHKGQPFLRWVRVKHSVESRGRKPDAYLLGGDFPSGFVAIYSTCLNRWGAFSIYCSFSALPTSLLS